MTVEWRAELAAQLDFYWINLFRPRLQGLTDDEYLWEPVPGCWSVRPAGNGTYTIDWEWPEPSPPPVTTIAWRLCHIASGVLGIRASNHFGDGTLSLEAIRWPGTAADGLRFLEESYAAWSAGVDAPDEAGLARPCGPAEGRYQDYPLATLILHINREVFHHAAEVTLLRDLYRESSARGRQALAAG